MEKINTILLIDDDEVNNYLNAIVIEESEMNAQVISFTKALEGLAFLKDFQKNDNIPQLILLDINMPEMDGWEFLYEYKKLPDTVKKHIVLVMLSSSVHEGDLNKAKKHKEVAAYISKPLTEESLLHIKKQHFYN